MAMAVPKGKSPVHTTAPGGMCDPELPAAKCARTHAQTPAHSEDEPEHECAVMEDDITPEELKAHMELSAKKRAATTPIFGRTKCSSMQSQYDRSWRLLETFCTKSSTEAHHQHAAHNAHACTCPTHRLQGPELEIPDRFGNCRFSYPLKTGGFGFHTL